jgi:parvulin-like peptidyl-prolyl isomerase
VLEMPSRARSFNVRLGGLAACLAAFGCSRGCNEAPAPGPTASASASALELTPELKAKVLARVGDRTITLGQYAATLARMGEFERLRYQSPDRRKVLLDEMIKVELLANEAKRRGLDKQPETQARLRQALRDELLRRTHEKLPKLSELPIAEVRAYYAAHKAEFQEPERRRVAHLQMSHRKRAAEVLDLAEQADAKEWGRLVRKHSEDRRPTSALRDPGEFAGDLGIVAAPGESGGENPKVPDALRQAVFRIAEIGGVFSELVEASGSYHIVRMIGKTDKRTRSFAEAERIIRLRLLEARAEQLERDLEKRLRQRYEIVVDEKAMKKLELPESPPKGT